MEFGKKNIFVKLIFFTSRAFLAWTYLFLARCVLMYIFFQTYFSGSRSRSSSANFYLENDIGGTAYFEFPRQYLGSQIKSYGGTLSYDLSFQGSSYVNSPDLILIGDDYQLYHTLNRRLRLSQNNEISVRFWPGDWRKNGPLGPIATKEEILMTLQNLQHMLLR